jgi:hypothetical protein
VEALKPLIVAIAISATIATAAYTSRQPFKPPPPEPPAAWCWVGGVGGLPCKYRKRFFNV